MQSPQQSLSRGKIIFSSLLLGFIIRRRSTAPPCSIESHAAAKTMILVTLLNSLLSKVYQTHCIKAQYYMFYQVHNNPTSTLQIQKFCRGRASIALLDPGWEGFNHDFSFSSWDSLFHLNNTMCLHHCCYFNEFFSPLSLFNAFTINKIQNTLFWF